MRKLKWLYHILNAMLLSGGTYWIFQIWDKIPNRIPIHFGLGGVPNRWTEKGAEFLLLCALPWILSGLMYLLASLVLRYPGLINIPHKREFLTLPREKQEPFLVFVSGFLHGLALVLNFMMFSLTYSIIVVAMGQYHILPEIFWVASLIMGIYTVFHVIAMCVMVGRIVKDAR